MTLKRIILFLIFCNFLILVNARLVKLMSEIGARVLQFKKILILVDVVKVRSHASAYRSKAVCEDRHHAVDRCV